MCSFGDQIKQFVMWHFTEVIIFMDKQISRPELLVLFWNPYYRPCTHCPEVDPGGDLSNL